HLLPPPPTPRSPPFPYTTLFRSQLLLRERARGIAHHALRFGELRLDEERIVPGEFRLLGLGFERGVHGNSPFGPQASGVSNDTRSEEHKSELQSRFDLVCRLLLE